MLHGGFRSLVLGQMLGQFGDGLAQIAFAHLVVFDIGHGATPGRIAAVLAATLLPFSIVGPLAGVFIDRWDRRRTLIIASVCRALLAGISVLAAFFESEIAAYVGVLVLLSSSRFVLDAKGSALPRTVDRDDLVRANAMAGLGGVAAAFVGAVGGAVFVGLWAPGGFVVAAGAYVAAATVFATLPDVGGGVSGDGIATALRRLVADLAHGGAVIVRTPSLRRPLIAVWAHRMLLGAGFVVLILVADRRYHLSTSGYGLALAVTGVSAFFGTVIAPWMAGRWRPTSLLPLAFLPPAAAIAVAGSAPTLTGLIAAVAVTAVAFQILKVTTDALVGAAAPDTVRGRVFAIYDVLYNLAFVLAGLAMVPFWHYGDERRLLWWVAAGFGLCWLAMARAATVWPFDGRGARAADDAGRDATNPWPGRGAAAAAGAVFVLVFPQPSLWWAAWFLLVPWLLLVRRATTMREAAVRGWCGGFGFLMAVHYWLLPSTTLFLPVAAGLLAMLWVPWASLAWWLRRQPHAALGSVLQTAVLAALWVLIEVVRSWSALGGPWGLLGASQWNAPRMLATASLGGIWLVTFLIVAVNVAVVVFVESRAWRQRATVAVVAAAALASGPVWSVAESQPSGDRVLRIAIVQAGVVHSPQERLDAQIASTQALTPGRQDLVVWGESSVGFDLFTRVDLQTRLATLSRTVGAPLLVNVDAAGENGAIRKVAVLVDANGIGSSYQKIRLVPFGEYIPMRQVLGWLSHISKAAAVNRVRGTDTTVFSVAGTEIGPLICFESAFPDMSRTVTRQGAQLLLFQVATTTFQGTWAPKQHASLAAVRAVETGRPAVQAALAGTTAVFDARGHRIAWWPHDRGTVTADIMLATRTTPYDRYGDWVPAWCIVIVAAAVIGWTLQRVRVAPGQVSSSPNR